MKCQMKFEHKIYSVRTQSYLKISILQIQRWEPKIDQEEYERKLKIKGRLLTVQVMFKKKNKW